MTPPDNDMPDDLPHDMDEYVSYADEVDVKEGRKKTPATTETGDTDQGDTEGDSQGTGGGPKPLTPEEQAALAEAEEEVKKSWLEKLKLIFIAPFSSIIPGTVSYTAENDLSKKAFFLRVGLYNRQIEPTDIADPDLMKKLEERHQERRERFQLGPAPRYVPPKPSSPNAPAAGLSLGGTSDSADGSGGDSSGGAAGGMKPVTEGGVSAEAVEARQVKNASIEERDLMASGSSIDQARAEIDEYITPEEFIQEISHQAAFSQIDVASSEFSLLQSFNVMAVQTHENVEAVQLNRQLRLSDRDGKQEITPILRNLDKT